MSALASLGTVSLGLGWFQGHSLGAAKDSTVRGGIGALKSLGFLSRGGNMSKAQSGLKIKG